MPQPSDTTANLIREGMQHQQAGRTMEAERLYRAVLAQDHTNPDALHLLGIIAGQAGRYAIAVELFRGALSRDPKNADLYQNLGEAFRHLGNTESALDAFARAIQLSPDLLQAYRNAADAAKAGAERTERAGQTRTARE